MWGLRQGLYSGSLQIIVGYTWQLVKVAECRLQTPPDYSNTVF